MFVAQNGLQCADVQFRKNYSLTLNQPQTNSQ